MKAAPVRFHRGQDPVADAAARPVEEVGGFDLEVLIGGVGEGSSLIAIAERVDALYAGLKTVVDLFARTSTAGPDGFRG
jgi:hypothetical protein